MPYLLVRQHVLDYEHWRAGYERDDAGRRGAGCIGAHLFRDVSEPSQVVILLEWDSIENARAYLDGTGPQGVLTGDGDSDAPEIQLLEVLRPSGV